jgi:hypothetical protein
MKKAIVIVAMAALACASFAQGGGEQGGRRMGMMRGGMMAPMSMLVNRADVQKELGISVEQRSKLRELQDKMQEERRAQFENMRGGGPPDPEAMRKMFTEMEAKSNQALSEVLSPEQLKRLKELSLQRSGMRALMNPNVQKELGLSAGQIAKIDELQTKQRDAMQAVMEKMRNGEIEREELRDLFEKNNRIMDDELGKLLTDAQRAKLDEMKGKPFTFDPDEDGRFGGR